MHRIDENVSGEVAPLHATTLYERLAAMIVAGTIVKSADGYRPAGMLNHGATSPAAQNRNS